MNATEEESAGTARVLDLIRRWPQPPTSRLALRARLARRRSYPAPGRGAARAARAARI